MQTYVKHHQVTAVFSDKIQKVTEKAVIETVSDVIIGDLHLRPRLRLIDELITGEQYLAVTNAVVYDKSGKARFKTRFLTVNREHIVLVIPWDEMERKQESDQFETHASLLNLQK